MIGTLDSKIPPGPLAQKWRNHRDHLRLMSPNNRRKLEIIVVGSGLAGGSAAATLSARLPFGAALGRGEACRRWFSASTCLGFSA